MFQVRYFAFNRPFSLPVYALTRRRKGDGTAKNAVLRRKNTGLPDTYRTENPCPVYRNSLQVKTYGVLYRTAGLLCVKRFYINY